jgi:iron complex outermembrane receptor protein
VRQGRQRWALVLAFSCSSAFAQQADVRLGTVQVVAPPIIEGNTFDAFGGQTTIVSDEQINDLNANDLTTALRRVPGVTISRFNPVGNFGGGEGGAVFIRGLGASRPGSEIKTFIDGVPFFMGVWNHPLLDLLPVNGMAAIDVRKGPQPWVVGNTFASINLTTQSAPASGVAGGVKVQAGSFGTFIQQADIGARSGAFAGYVAQGYQQSNGNRPDADGRLANLLAKGGVTINENWSAGVTFLGVDNSVTDPGPEGSPQLRNGVYKTNGSLLVGTLSHQYERARGEIKFYWNEGEGNWFRQAGTAGNTFTDWTSYGVRARETLRLWQGGELLGGLDLDWWTGNVDFQPTNARSARFDGPTFRLVSPYLGLAQTFDAAGWRIVPSGGVRYYDHNEFGAEWAPYAGLTASRGPFAAYAGYGRGVNYPGLDVVVFSQNVIRPLGQSWRNLNAETNNHVEFGFRYTQGPLAADLVFFRDQIDNRYVFVPPPPPPPVYVNSGGQTTKGIEGTVAYELSRALSVFGGITLLDANPGDAPYVPRQQYVLGVTGTVGPARYSIDAEYVSSMYVLSRARTSTAVNNAQVDGYFLLNARLFYPLPPLSRQRSEVFVALNNITNASYEYRPGYPMPGFSFLAGVSLRF